MTSERTIGPREDPVCGMTVDPADAKAKGLVARHGDRDFALCSRGCLAAFQADPERYLKVGYRPTMGTR